VTANSQSQRPAARKTEPAGGSRTSGIDVSPLLDSVGDMALGVVGGRIRYVNRAAIELLGAEQAGEIVGQALEAIIDPRTIHRLLLRRREAGGADKDAWLRAPLRRVDGGTVEIDLEVVPLTEPDAFAVIARRIDAASLLDPDTPAAALHAAEGLKNLIANMAHELRTPLNAIIGFSEIIAQRMFGDLNDRYAAYAGDIVVSGQHLLRIINDILDYAKVEAGEMALRVERVSVSEVVRASFRLVSSQAQQGGVQIVDQLADVQPLLYMDSTKVKQIVVNLMSNAIKFTPRGGKVTVGTKHLGGQKVAVWVKDTGIGMTEAELAEAMLPFRQPKRAPDGSYAGTGLGLPIAKALVALHGGEFSITSTPKVGTEVRFTLMGQPETRSDTGK